MAFSLDVSSRSTSMNDYNCYNEDLKSNYYKYKQIFEEVTKLTPQEHLYVQKHHLEDKLASINFDFWKHVNSIVTSYFDIIKLLQKKREAEIEINRIWCSKLSSTYVGDQGNQDTGTQSSSTWNNVVPNPTTDRMTKTSTVSISGLRIVPTIEDRVMRFKVASVFSVDLIKTIHRTIFSVKNDQVLPGSSNLKQLEKEAKWFRNHKKELESEIEKLEEHKKTLRKKIDYTPPNEAAIGEINNKTKTLRNLFKYFRVMNYS